MTEVILLKLGGSLITEKARRETSRPEVIARLAEEIARAAARIPQRLVLGHGSGSFGHAAAHEHGIAGGAGGGGLLSPAQLLGISLTQERAAALHREVAAALTAAGLSPFSIAPSSCVVLEAGRPAGFFGEPLLHALRNGLLPVVYGDVVMDRSQGVAICSTERALEIVARFLPEQGLLVRRALWAGETDGVYDAAGQTCPHLSAEDFESVAIDSPAAGTDVTGGMRHRIDTALVLARRGIHSRLFNGLIPGLLERALLGETVPGTEIL
ncbi:MAG TPA: isopentenyl phosphate kinase [Thermoanaerobaculia bacterium]|nr:isopentenyl phosphate kinase [Thermoanaerobaculia bacterium]